MIYLVMFIGFCVMIYISCICLKKRKQIHLNHQDKLQKKNEIYHLSGIVQPAEEIEILPYVNGFVENVYVKRGQVVDVGEILLQIGQRPYIVAKETSYANLQRAKQYLKKIQASYQQIKDKNNSTEKEVKQAEATFLSAQKNVKNALAKYEQAFQNYTYTTLKSPVKGVLTQVNVRSKNYVSPAGKCLFRLLNKSSVTVKCQLSDMLYKDLTDLSPISKNVWTVQLIVSENPPCIYTGILKSAESNPNVQKSQMTVYFEFPNPDNVFKEGDKLHIQMVQNKYDNEWVCVDTKSRTVPFYPVVASFDYQLKYSPVNTRINPHL